MVKRILLLALISSRTAAVGRFIGIRSGSYVVGRSGKRGCGSAAAGDLSLSLYLSVDPSIWVTGGGSVTLDWRGNR